MEQLLMHLFGDYIVQSHWMANNKTKHWWPALAHASAYSASFAIACCFGILSWRALFVIWSTHYVIDRYRLARYVVWAKNWIGPATRSETNAEALERARCLGLVSRSPVFEGDELNRFLTWLENNRSTVSCNLSWTECYATGNPPDVPPFLAVWLMIIADNTIHLCVNYAAMRWL
jgi:hypothetical protein